MVEFNMPAARTPIEQRRGSKPLVEKKRRARINQSLAELQALVVDTKKKKQGSKQARVEKADILEMTVRHLRSLQQQHKEEFNQIRNDKFHSGYIECVEEVQRFLSKSKHRNSAALSERLRTHLLVRLPAPRAIDLSRTTIDPNNSISSLTSDDSIESYQLLQIQSHTTNVMYNQDYRRDDIGSYPIIHENCSTWSKVVQLNEKDNVKLTMWRPW